MTFRTPSFLYVVSVIFLCAVGLLLSSTSAAHAAANEKIHYQGKLYDSSSSPVTDGSYDIEFKIYTVSSGGAPIWNEIQTVTTVGGLFSVMLGSVSSLSGVGWNQGLYLGLTVESDSEMTPRHTVGAVPAAHTIVGQLAVAQGGTGTSTVAAAGAVFFAGAAGDHGSNANFLYVNGSTGNVGIGTSTPAFKLDVNGDTRINSGGLLRFYRPDGVTQGFAINSGTGNTFLSASVGGLHLNSVAGSIFVNTTTDFSVGNLLGTVNYMTVKSSGNIGIGTTTPSARLDIYGTSTAATTDLFAVSSSSKTRLFTVAPSGNVGIGTTTPIAKLDVDGQMWIRAGSAGTLAASAGAGLKMEYSTSTDRANIQAYDYTTDTSKPLHLNALGGIISTGPGNVGIGTSSPLGVLSVKGAGTGTGVNFTTTNSSNARLFSILDNGNVGIGTTTPMSKLSIESATASSEDVLNITGGADNSTEYTGIKLWNNLGQNSIAFRNVLETSGIARLGIYLKDNAGTSETERFSIISNTGNVGIGTTSPSAALHVVGTVPMVQVGDASKGTTRLLLTRTQAGTQASIDTAIYSNNSPTLQQIWGGQWSGENAGTTDGSNRAMIMNFVPAGNLFQIASVPNGSFTSSNFTSHLALNVSTGHVGIGTTTPAARLTLTGTSGSSAKLFAIASSSGAELLTFTSAGRLGIGATSPSADLEVVSKSAGANAEIRVQNDGTATGNTSLVLRRSDADKAVIENVPGGQGLLISQNHTSGNIRFATGATPTERMRITADGNVGIGTSSPLGVLSVKGAGTGTGVNFTTTNSSNLRLFSILDNGNVGIGTTTPVAKLSIAANVPTFEMFDTNQTAPAGLYTIQNQSDRLSFFRGVLGVSAVERMRIASSGAIMSADGFSIDTLSGGLFTGTHLTHFPSSGASYINNGGNVGIGTSSPLGVLSVKGAGTGTGVNFTTTNSSNARLFSILDNGNVGIGTTSPVAKLAITGSAGANIFVAASSDSVERMRIDSSGNVHIGSATSRLNVYSRIASGADSTDYRPLEIRPAISNTSSGAGLSLYGGVSTGSGGGVTIAGGDESSGGFGAGGVTIAGGTGFGAPGQGGSISIAAGIGTASNGVINLSTADVNRLHITGAGNVGIGTVSPLFKLQVVGSGASELALGDNTGSMGRGILYQYNGSGQLVNRIDGASNSYFTSGNIGIGTTSPNVALHVGSASVQSNVKIARGYLCVDNNDTCTGATTAGTVYAVGAYTTGADVAENYPTNDTTLVPGEIVAVEGHEPAYVVRATSTKTAFGIISTAPGVLLAGFDKATSSAATKVAVALAGRVPVKFSLENGPVTAGDRITLSSEPGVAMKASATSTLTLGIALEDYDEEGDGTVLTFVNLQDNVGATALDVIQSLGLNVDSLASTTAPSVDDEGEKTFLGRFFDRMISWFAEATNGIGDFFANTLRARDEICVGSTCVTESQLATLLAGVGATSTPGTSGSTSTTEVISLTFTPEDLELSETTATTSDLMNGVTAMTMGTTTTIANIEADVDSVFRTNPGVYMVTYRATNNLGESITKDRKVTVLSDETFTITPLASSTDNGTGDTENGSGTPACVVDPANASSTCP